MRCSAIIRPVLVCGVALLPLFAVAAANSGRSAAEELEAIRSELIEAATRASTRVQSAAWIDFQGRLFESARFTSDVRARPQASARSVEPSTRAEICEGNRRYKRHAVFEVRRPQGGRFLSAATLSRLSEQFSQELMTVLAAETGWALTQAQRPGPRATYDRALLNRVVDAAPFIVSMQLIDLGTAPILASATDRPQWVSDSMVSLGLSDPPPTEGLVALVISLSQPSSPREIWSSQVQLRLRRASGGYLDSLQVVLADPAATQSAFKSLQAAFRDGLGCGMPDYPVLERTRSGELLINAGRRVGLDRGERLLLAPRGKLPRHVLEPGVVEALALAEIIAVTEDRAVIRVIAGPAPESIEQLVAMPF
ncbi:MAG: hypothetical protein EBQ76_06980 [Betaproteobacteria bacterium]|nr:hypothetical protein [Betaproteobacteria bacterium]NBY14460.1 hypothetical protein [Betaproteobacteria bacterium]